MNLPLHVSTGAIVQAPLVLVDCETDQGVVGHAYLMGISPVSLKPLVSLLHSLSELLAGDALAPYDIERKLSQKFTLLGMNGLLRLAQSGIDMAAWDALARSQNLPLATLLGSAPKPVRAYNSKGLGIMPVAKLIDEAQALLDEGFNAIKMRLGRASAHDDLAAVRAVRKAVGDSVEVMSDFNQALSVHEAIRRGHMLDGEGLVWIEEPVRQDDYVGCAKVAAELKTPIQIGENFASSHEMLVALKAGASDLVMPDAQRIGGVSGWLRAATLAQAEGIEMSTHLFSEVSAHLMAVTPTAHWLEYVDWANPVLQQPLQIKDGFVLTSERPGSGIEWDEAAVAKYLLS
jgi:mandelate racemase